MEELVAFLRGVFPGHYHDRLFLVGGVVRDFLIGRSGEDVDLIADIPGGYLQSLGFRHVEAKSAAPVYFLSHGAFGKIEITLLEDGATIHDDLLHRDFTINAVSMSLDGDVIDPLDGRKDMAEGLLRACSAHALRDDPIRIFRAFRFEAEGWRLDDDTEKLVAGVEWSPLMRGIPVERFSLEMLKALGKDDPVRFFRRMLDLRVGSEFLPELFRMESIPAGPAGFHPDGNLAVHSLQTLQGAARATGNSTARFCALFHDLGKLATSPALYPRHFGHDTAGYALARDFCNRLRLPASLRKALMWTCRLHLAVNRWSELRVSTKMRVAEQALKAGIADILPLVSAADKPEGSGPGGWRAAVRIAGLTTAELGIDRERLMVIPVDDRQAFIIQKRTETFRKER